MTVRPPRLPATPDVEQKVRKSFARQAFMRTIGASLTSVEAGEVHIEVPVRADLSQQHGFVHAGVIVSVVDSACGYAALSVADLSVEVLTVELKVNLLAPAAGDSVRAVGRVVRRGRTLTVCQGDAFAVSGDEDKHVATLLATMITTTP